jgi:YD repeat-containing protein
VYLPSSVRPFLLTGVTDQDGVKTATWTYDSKGRATASTHSGGTERWAYMCDDVKQQVTVTDPGGSETVFNRVRDSDGLTSLTLADPAEAVSGKPSALPPSAASPLIIIPLAVLSCLLGAQSFQAKSVRFEVEDTTSLNMGLDAQAWHGMTRRLERTF